jgi:hypothetical protein
LTRLAKKGPVILTRKGKPLVSVKDLAGKDWEALALANNPRFLALIKQSRQSYQEEGGLSLEDIRQEFGLPAKRVGKTRRKRNAT